MNSGWSLWPYLNLVVVQDPELAQPGHQASCLPPFSEAPFPDLNPRVGCSEQQGHKGCERPRQSRGLVLHRGCRAAVKPLLWGLGREPRPRPLGLVLEPPLLALGLPLCPGVAGSPRATVSVGEVEGPGGMQAGGGITAARCSRASRRETGLCLSRLPVSACVCVCPCLVAHTSSGEVPRCWSRAFSRALQGLQDEGPAAGGAGVSVCRLC